MRNKLVARRKKLGYTQEEVAKIIKRKRNTYATYELGLCTPPFEIIVELKKLFKYKKDDLFDNESSKIN